jgi:sulfide:quinone oxidoreductase
VRNFRVLIAAAGVAAVETLLALRHLAGDRVEVDVPARVADFVYRPVTVLEPRGSRHLGRPVS